MTSKQRKEKSEALLYSLGITPPDVVPEIDEVGYALRSGQQIARRILILTYLNCVASEPSLQQEVMMFLIREKLWAEATRHEQELFHKQQLSDEEDLIFWRKESIWILLWVLGGVNDAGTSDKEVDLYEIFPLLPGFFESTDAFIKAARVRDIDEIFAQQDFYFRLSWILRTGNTISTTALIPGVVHERSLSMNWITGLNGQWV